MKPEDAPKPGTKVTIEYEHLFNPGHTYLREATVTGEPYAKGYNCAHGGWSLYPPTNESYEPCFYLPLRPKYKKRIGGFKMDSMLKIREGWNWTWETFHAGD